MRWRYLGHWAVAVGLAACGGAPPPPTDLVLTKAGAAPHASREAPPARARNNGPFVNDIARFIDGASISATAEMSAIRGNRWTADIVAILPYAESLSRAHVDAATDFDRIFLGSRSAGEHGQDMAVYEHHIDDKRVQAFIDLAIRESEPAGKRMDVAGHSCARLNRRHLSGVACVASSTLLLVTLDPNPELLGALATSRGVYPLKEGEAFHMTILAPAETLHLDDVGPVPNLGTMEMSATVPPAGGFDVVASAHSSSPTADANTLQSLFLARVQGMRIGPMSVPPPPVTFEAVNEDVVMKLAVSSDDLDLVTSLMKLTLPL